MLSPGVGVLVEFGTEDGELDSGVSVWSTCAAGSVRKSFMNSLLEMWSDVLVSKLMATINNSLW